MPRILREALEGSVYLTRGEKPIGTGFLVGVADDPGGEPEFDPYAGACYVVTARHLLIRKEGLGVRMNGVDGRPLTIATDAEQWIESENEHADVAIAYLPPSNQYERQMTDSRNIADDQWTADNVMLGDDVAFIGLFSRAPGRERNLPVVRFGSVARLNEETVPAQILGLRYDLDAILWRPALGPATAGLRRPSCTHDSPRHAVSSGRWVSRGFASSTPGHSWA